MGFAKYTLKASYRNKSKKFKEVFVYKSFLDYYLQHRLSLYSMEEYFLKLEIVLII